MEESKEAQEEEGYEENFALAGEFMIKRRLALAAVFLATVVGTVVGIWFLTRGAGNGKNRTDLGGEKIEVVENGANESDERKTERLKRSLFCEVRDEKAPEISLNGLEVRTMAMGGEYVEEGAVAKDDCDGVVEILERGEVDTKKTGMYEVRYLARDMAGNKSEIVRKIQVVDPNAGEKVVYLTFDDGPSEHTGRLLDVLKKYGVKATFFVTGRGADEMIWREFEEGHTVALHTNTHNYAYVYSSETAYFEDLYTIRGRVERITGAKPTLIRFPGGSSNTVSGLYNRGIMSRLVGEVERRGFRYVDWNVSSGDAEGAGTAEGVFDRVTTTLKDGVSVVLQHDTMGFSVDAVGRIIEYGMKNGYVFLPMGEDAYLVHHGVNN